jgi:hypothetical protein
MKVSAGLTLAAVMLSAGAASAQEGAGFGKQGQFVVSGERLFGIVFASERSKQTVNNVEVTNTQSYTNINFLANATGRVSTTYSFARVGFDYLPIDGLTVGGSLAFYTLSGENETEGNGMSASQDTGSGNGFLLAPRAGYAFMFMPLLGIWPRGGITWLIGGTESGSGNTKTSMSRLALTMEVPLVITPIPHAGFTVGPTLDLGLTGSDEIKNTDNMGVTTTTKLDTVGTDIGVQAGMFVYF